MEPFGEKTRSKRGDCQVYLRFLNLCDRTVEILWVDFNGAFVCYKCLDSGCFVDVNTFKDHPWIAVDHHTKQRLHINKEFVHIPAPPTTNFFQNRAFFMDFRIRTNAAISLPVYSLKYNSLLAVMNLIKVPNDADKLTLPRAVISDLKKLVLHRNQIAKACGKNNR